MKKLKEKSKLNKTKETQEEELRQTFLHTRIIIHTNMPYTQLCFDTRLYHTHRPLHTDVYTHIYIQRRFYTQNPFRFF